MEQLPAHRPPTVVQLPDGCHVYAAPALPAQQPAGTQVVHIQQASPERTVQRVTLRSGVGAGAVAAGVYLGPLLVRVLTASAASLMMLTFLAAVMSSGVVAAVRSVGGSHGKAAAKRLRRGC
ncbi:DUF6251 family protein [Streptomyces sp. NRRL WC-3744]|uniref:DUF6251 family protein n=1 Tax=Streptomyces sp. NRRL WC-3744 TaxID=1463935 RepID=UPI0004C56F2D|nr:DUF6251 family protein [Streptomyces sp. NRRL WC-3744]